MEGSDRRGLPRVRRPSRRRVRRSTRLAPHQRLRRRTRAAHRRVHDSAPRAYGRPRAPASGRRGASRAAAGAPSRDRVECAERGRCTGAHMPRRRCCGGRRRRARAAVSSEAGARSPSRGVPARQVEPCGCDRVRGLDLRRQGCARRRPVGGRRRRRAGPSLVHGHAPTEPRRRARHRVARPASAFAAHPHP